MSRKTAGLVVLLSLLVALFAFPVFAQALPGSVVGTVTAGGSAISSITVTLWDTDSWDVVGQTVSASNGAFAFQDLPEDAEYSVKVEDDEYYRYLDASVDFWLESGETEVIAIALTPDTEAPMIQLSDNPTGPRSYSDEDVRALLDASDHWMSGNGVGVASVLYSVNGAPSVLTTQAPGRDNLSIRVPTFTIDGISVITYSATDHAGNKSKTHVSLIYIDKSAPVTGYDMKAATGSSIMLVPSDSGAGVAATYWRIGSAGAFTQGNWVPVPATGVATLEFYSVDKAGNLEAVKSMTIQSRASLTKPKASTASPRAGKTFYVRGAVVGKSAAAGTLRVYKLVNGKYKYVSKKSFKESSTGTYKVAFKLKKGTYKFKAFYGANTATASNPPVNSVYSARSVVR